MRKKFARWCDGLKRLFTVRRVLSLVLITLIALIFEAYSLQTTATKAESYEEVPTGPFGYMENFNPPFTIPSELCRVLDNQGYIKDTLRIKQGFWSLSEKFGNNNPVDFMWAVWVESRFEQGHSWFGINGDSRKKLRIKDSQVNDPVAQIMQGHQYFGRVMPKEGYRLSNFLQIKLMGFDPASYREHGNDGHVLLRRGTPQYDDFSYPTGRFRKEMLPDSSGVLLVPDSVNVYDTNQDGVVKVKEAKLVFTSRLKRDKRDLGILNP